jgi:hypothetical protein
MIKRILGLMAFTFQKKEHRDTQSRHRVSQRGGERRVERHTWHLFILLPTAALF